MREALRIQDPFMAGPLFTKTNWCYLKSEGVPTLQRIQHHLHHRPAPGK